MHNVRPYILIGSSLSIDVGNSIGLKDPNDDYPLEIQRLNYYAEAGVGFDFYFNWFKMSTELKMSYGFKEILKDENFRYGNNIWYDPIESLKSKVFQFSVTFE